MRLYIGWVKSGGSRSPGVQELTAHYLKRIAPYSPPEAAEYRSEAQLLAAAKKLNARFVLLESAGAELSSEKLADFLRRERDAATAKLFFAVGPHDGFSPAAHRAAFFRLSLGKLTLPHELARVVLLEQLYRGFTILAGHPYHLGH